MLKVLFLIISVGFAAIGSMVLALCMAAGQADKLPQPKVEHKD